MKTSMFKKGRRVADNKTMKNNISKKRSTARSTNSAANISQKRMKTRKTNQKPKQNLENMTVDDFMKGGFNSSDESDDDLMHIEEGEGKKGVPVNGVSKVNEGGGVNYEVNHNNSDSHNSDDCDEEENKLNEEGNDETNWASETYSHKKAVAKLQETDPEFYKYLQENDKDLLDFDGSDSDDDSGDDEKGGKIHVPPENLEVASDDSDYEDGVKRDPRIVTLKMVQDWETRLHMTKSCDVIKEVVHALYAVYLKVSNEEDNSARYVVTGSNVFNAVVRLCVLELQPALQRYLNIKSGSHVDPTKNVRWHILKRTVKFYLENLLKLVLGVTSSQVISVLLKHCHQMMPYAASFPKLSKLILKVLVKIWCEGEETPRVLAFLCILRLVTRKQDKLLEPVMKTMYLAYIRNCKFMSPTTLPAINFMRLSLVEIFALNLNVGYKHVFLYIRQLAIQLRNAMTKRTKESMQSVYNWQVINSLRLWADLLGNTANKPQLQSLVYPFVQVTLGTIDLISTPYYFPLRFHCLHMLIQLSKKTSTFIPVLPLILEALKTTGFNKENKDASMRPLDFTFINRVTKTQRAGNAFKEATLDKVYELLLEHLANESNSIAFPDLVVPTVIELKNFLKTYHDPKVTKKVKQLLDKIKSNADMVEEERSKVSFPLNDQKAIAAWETQLELKGTPLSTFYKSWREVHNRREAQKIQEKLGDFNVPVIKKRPKGNAEVNDEGPVDILPSDSEDDLNILKMDGKKEKRNKRGKTASNVKKIIRRTSGNEQNNEDNDQGDIVENLKWKDFK